MSELPSKSPQLQVQKLQNKIDIETKIKDGAENLLHVFDLKLGSSAKQDLRRQIESELDTANNKISALHSELVKWKEIERTTSPAPPTTSTIPSSESTVSSNATSSAANRIPLSRPQHSALGLEHQPPLFLNEAGPSRIPDSTTSYQVMRMHNTFRTGSPPSSIPFTHEHSSSTANPTAETSATTFGGLGIGLDGNFSPTISNSKALKPHNREKDSVTSTNGKARATHSEIDNDADRENEDAPATRALVTALIRSLQAQSPRPPLAKLPTMPEGSPSDEATSASLSAHASDSNVASAAATTTTTSALDNLLHVGPSTTMVPPTLPRVARRAIARNRVALANGGLSHARTPSNAAGLADPAKRQIDTISRLITILKRNARVRYELPLDELVQVAIPCLSDHSGKEIRAATYRLLRHALVHPLWPLVSRCRSRGLNIYLSRSFIRDNRFEQEKEQAIKLVRTIMELSALRTVNAAPDRLAIDLEELIGSGVVRSIAAVAEHPDDKLRYLCLETLAELAIFDVRLLIKGGGLRVTLQALSEGPSDFAPTLIQTFLYLIDMPGTRKHLRPGVDLDVAISGFTDVPVQKPVTYDGFLRSTAKVVSVILRSWTGLIYMCMDDKRAIKSLVQALRINPNEIKDMILDMLLDLFNVQSTAPIVDPASKRDSGQKQNASTKASSSDQDPLKTASPFGDMAEQPRTRLNLVDHYLALLLVVFIECGLVDALVDVIEHASEMSRKATLLMGELLQVSKRVHPPSIGRSIHSLPHLFALAANFKMENSDERQAAASALSSIDRVNRQRAHHQLVTAVAAANGSAQPVSRDRSNSIEESVRRGQRQAEKTKIRIGMQIDDNQFRNLMIDTQILHTKDHVKWNLDTLTEMLEGPLMNPKRLDEVIRGTKFLKRLLSFFHPFSLRFSSIRKASSNRRFVKLGCLLLSTLICTPEGIRALAEDRLLREIRECLEQLDPLTGAPVTDPLMSKSRLEETLTLGYFEMIGVLTQSVEGIRLLERFKMFSPLYHLSELRSRDDIIKAVIENVDYSIDGHTRIVLSKALTSNYRHVRLFATKHLAELIRKATPLNSNATQTENPHEWMVGLLLAQLYDPSIEVREMAVKVVEEACASIDILERVVAMRPTLDHLGEIGHPLLLKFMSTSIGFRYLWQGDYIDREMDHWFNERNQRYTVQVEVTLANVFSIYGKPTPAGKFATATGSTSGVSAAAATDGEMDGTVPSHFYGELTKTKEGCQILKQKGHFAEFIHFIRQHGMEDSDAELITKLKSVLWAVGNIGSNVLGLPFLEAEDVISQIVDIAENSLVMSVRGTCFFVLGLISATKQGAEMLQDYGWISVSTPLGVPMGLCIPTDINRLIMMPSWSVQKISNLSYLELIEPETVVENKVITSIANLGNSILANNASRTLTKLKAKHKSAFQNMSLLARAVELMDSFYIRLPIRRYIWELFDVGLNEDVVRALQLSKQKLIEAKKLQLQQRKDSQATLAGLALNSQEDASPRHSPHDQFERDVSLASLSQTASRTIAKPASPSPTLAARTVAVMPRIASSSTAIKPRPKLPMLSVKGLGSMLGIDSDEDGVDHDSEIGAEDTALSSHEGDGETSDDAGDVDDDDYDYDEEDDEVHGEGDEEDSDTSSGSHSKRKQHRQQQRRQGSLRVAVTCGAAAVAASEAATLSATSLRTTGRRNKPGQPLRGTSSTFRSSNMLKEDRSRATDEAIMSSSLLNEPAEPERIVVQPKRRVVGFGNPATEDAATLTTSLSGHG